MHRSQSGTRVADEFYRNGNSTTVAGDDDDSGHGHSLPMYSPSSDVAKKERSRLRSAENAVHLIPLILLLCAIILWSFSNPVDVNKKADSIVARDERLKTAGSFEVDGTYNHPHLEHPELEDVGLLHHPHHHHQHQSRFKPSA